MHSCSSSTQSRLFQKYQKNLFPSSCLGTQISLYVPCFLGLFNFNVTKRELRNKVFVLIFRVLKQPAKRWNEQKNINPKTDKLPFHHPQNPKTPNKFHFSDSELPLGNLELPFDVSEFPLNVSKFHLDNSEFLIDDSELPYNSLRVATYRFGVAL